MVRKAVSFGLSFLAVLASIPLVVTVMKFAEPRVAPVVRNVQFELTTENVWRVTFDKVRACELEAVYWFDGHTWSRQPFVSQFTRPVGPAVIENWPMLDGTNPSTDTAIVRHMCHPLYTTETVFNRP